MSVGRIKAYSI